MILKSTFRHFLFASVLFLFSVGSPLTAAPATPKTFDKATVEELIRDIDKPRNAAILRVIYFGRRGYAYPFPVEEGWDALNQAILREKPNTKRWFLLQRVKSNVAFQLRFVNPKDGLVSYKELFDQAKVNGSADSDYVIRSAIHDYVELVVSIMGKLDLYHTELLQETTLAAWEAYERPTTDKYALRVPRPNWILALEKSGEPKDMKNILEKQMKSVQAPSYDLLSLYSYIIGEEDDRRAAEILRRAENLLPKSNSGDVDITEAKKYYARLYELYKKIHDEKQANWAYNKLVSLK